MSSCEAEIAKINKLLKTAETAQAKARLQIAKCCSLVMKMTNSMTGISETMATIAAHITALKEQVGPAHSNPPAAPEPPVPDA